MAPLLTNPVATTFLIILLGLLLGRVQVRGLSLGASGVLFVALLFGHFHWIEPAPVRVLGDFGVVLFVYAIGLQAGGRFVRTLRSKGWAPLVVVLGTVLSGAAIAAGLGYLLGLTPAASVGVFAGALTSTPALAAATEVSNDPLVAVAYGLSYPFGIFGVVLFAQLIPRWVKDSPQRAQRETGPEAAEAVQQRAFVVENPGCIGKSMAELRLHELVAANISRMMRGMHVQPVTSDIVLQKDDVLLAVGTNAQLDRLSLLIGPPVPVEVEMREVPNVVARDIHITEAAFAGRSLRALHVRSKYEVVITRVRREGFEFVPRGEFVLEIGDLARVVGYEPDVKRFVEAAGIHERRVHETGIAAFTAGLVIGMLLGFTPLPLPGVGEFKLGLAGGPLFAGILFAHFGRIGQLRIYVPTAARYLMRELGLVLFLVSAGAGAGAELVPVLREQGLALAGIAVAAVVVSTGVGFVVSFYTYGQTVASALGMTCGAMTSTPGLGAAASQFESDVPTLSYATVYPLALIAMTVAAQVMLAVLT